jgi:hypothetical protein
MFVCHGDLTLYYCPKVFELHVSNLTVGAFSGPRTKICLMHHMIQCVTQPRVLFGN